LCAFLLSPMSAACPINFIILYFIFPVIFSEACKLWSYSLGLCIFLSSRRSEHYPQLFVVTHPQFTHFA
jgi:hypothetical protein